MFRRDLLAAALLGAALPAAAQTTNPTTNQARPKVVATFSILGDLLGEVGGGEIELAVAVGPDTDAHSYQPKPTDARTLALARALVSNGLGFEGWIDRLVKAAPFTGRAIVASTGVPTLEAQSSGRGQGVDPHCWQDVTRTRRYVANIAEGLIAVDAGNAALYRARAEAYDGRLAALDQWIKAEIAKVPPAQRKAITSHESLRYFAQAYGVQLDAPLGYIAESEPSARDVAALIRLVREQKIKALFIENMTNARLIEQIARESGGVVGPRLYTDALSPPDGPAATYEALMRHNVTALVTGMLKN
jgi:zinc/manganese transport system substrate-binding protein